MTTYTNQYNEALSIRPELAETLKQITGISLVKAPDQLLATLIKTTHHGALSNASGNLAADLRWEGWKTIKNWLKAGSTVCYLYGESLDVLLVDHLHGYGIDAYKGYSILGGGEKRSSLKDILEIVELMS